MGEATHSPSPCRLLGLGAGRQYRAGERQELESIPIQWLLFSLRVRQGLDAHGGEK